MPSFRLYWFRVYGLGFACEPVSVCSDDLTQGWTALSVRAYVGPLYVASTIRVTPKRALPLRN